MHLQRVHPHDPPYSVWAVSLPLWCHLSWCHWETLQRVRSHTWWWTSYPATAPPHLREKHREREWIWVCVFMEFSRRPLWLVMAHVNLCSGKAMYSNQVQMISLRIWALVCAGHWFDDWHCFIGLIPCFRRKQQTDKISKQGQHHGSWR